VAFAMFVFSENNTACRQRSSFAIASGDSNPPVKKYDELPTGGIVRCRCLIKRLNREELHATDIDSR
jgi:hypothetical protein